MVELRKRPQRDPPAPAPATKRSKAKATSTPASTEPKPESSAAPTGVVGKAKRAAAKVKEAVTGSVDASESGNTESAAKQPSVQDEPAGAAVETGETGMIPETAGTAPSTTTIPAAETGTADASSSGAAAATTVPSVTAAEGKKGRGKAKNVGTGASTAAAAPVSAPAPVTAHEATTEATTATAESGTATTLPNTTSAEGKAIRSKAKTLGLAGSSTAAPAATADTPAAATTTTPAASATADPTGEESRPPATEDLENPPETGKIDTSSTTAAAPTATATSATPSSLEPATLPLSPTSVGKQLTSLSTFGGPLETHTGSSTTFADLLTASTSGLIIFTYPRASTPGCTQQACSFRDNHDAFTRDSGYKVYGLSTDSVKANSGFATKQGLQYELLCDGNAGLTGALGMKKAGNAKGTVRGVVVVDKGGVVRVWFQGGPAKTVDAVKEFLSAVAK